MTWVTFGSTFVCTTYGRVLQMHIYMFINSMELWQKYICDKLPVTYVACELRKALVYYSLVTILPDHGYFFFLRHLPRIYGQRCEYVHTYLLAPMDIQNILGKLSNVWLSQLMSLATNHQQQSSTVRPNGLETRGFRAAIPIGCCRVT